MISKISKRIVDALCVALIVDEDDRELYTYGFFVLISRVFFFIVTIILGIAFEIAWESILFYIIFTSIRSYAGGVHASKESLCMLYTSLALIASAVTIKIFVCFEMTTVSAIILLAGYLSIAVLSPLDTNEKPLDGDSRRKYKKISIVVATVVLVGAIVLYIFDMKNVAYTCAVTVGVESVLLCIGAMKKKEVTFIENKN